MGIFKYIKGYRYYKILAEKYRDRCYFLMDQKSGLISANDLLENKVSELTKTIEELQEKLYDSLAKNIESAETIVYLTEKLAKGKNKEQ
jgi:hypothetical protein